MRDLPDLRKELDQINLDLLRLLEKRFTLVDEVVHLKKEQNLSMYDETRVEHMLNRIMNQSHGTIEAALLRQIFTVIFDASLKHMCRGFDHKN